MAHTDCVSRRPRKARAKIVKPRDKETAREWLATAADEALLEAGLGGLEDVMVLAFGPVERWQIFVLVDVRACIHRALNIAAELGRSQGCDARSAR